MVINYLRADASANWTALYASSGRDERDVNFDSSNQCAKVIDCHIIFLARKLNNKVHL